MQVVEEIQLMSQTISKAWLPFRFNNSSEMTRGEAIWTNIVERVVRETPFQVVDGDKAYNAILVRLWIHEMDAVPSTLHKVIKFLSKLGIQEI